MWEPGTKEDANLYQASGLTSEVVGVMVSDESQVWAQQASVGTRNQGRYQPLPGE